MSRVRRDDGFTLIELLVGITIGTVVLLGAFTIIDQAMPATTRIADRAAAQGRGRTALEQILQNLRSSVCVQQGVAPSVTYLAPIDATSTDSSLTFYSQQIAAPSGTTGTTDPAISTTFAPEKRTVQVSGAQLVETRSVGTYNAGTATWTFPSSGAGVTTRTVLANIEQDGSTAYFRYFAYDAATGTLTQLNPGAGVPVGSTDAPRITRVAVAFRAGPGGNGAGTNGVDVKARLQGNGTVQVPVDFTSNATAAKGPQCSF